MGEPVEPSEAARSLKPRLLILFLLAQGWRSHWLPRRPGLPAARLRPLKIPRHSLHLPLLGLHPARSHCLTNRLRHLMHRSRSCQYLSQVSIAYTTQNEEQAAEQKERRKENAVVGRSPKDLL